MSPALNESRIPSGSTCTDSLFANSKTHPIIERIVEYHHILDGRVFKNNHSKTPDNIGALPIVTTVPTATPVTMTAEKKSGW